MICHHVEACKLHEPGHHIAGRCHIPGSIGCAFTELRNAVGELFRPAMSILKRLADWVEQRLTRGGQGP